MAPTSTQHENDGGAAAAEIVVIALSTLLSARDGGDSRPLPPGASVVCDAVWTDGNSRVRSSLSTAGDVERRPCLLDPACEAEHRGGALQLKHALRVHPDRVVADGHAVALSMNYSSAEAATAELMKYVATLGVRLRRTYSEGDRITIECSSSIRGHKRAYRVELWGIVWITIPHTASLTHTASSPSAGAFAC